jgi:hypothetical protein
MLTHFLPAGVQCRESYSQYNLNPALCQRTTVSGWTKIYACFHPGQKLRKRTRTICLKRQLVDLGIWIFSLQSDELLPQS